MTPQEFCYWLQGFFEVSDVSDIEFKSLNALQIQVIRSHLALVFKKETPVVVPPKSTRLRDEGWATIPFCSTRPLDNGATANPNVTSLCATIVPASC